MSSSAHIGVRDARAADADAVVAVVRDSITHLCVRDHHNASHLLDSWLENKTAANFLSWLNNPENYCAVAEAEGICGVGLLHRSGEIQLMYVSPLKSRQGVGRALLNRIESQARSWGLPTLHLSSTATARSFYESAGYRDRNESETWRGIVCYKYDKAMIPIT